MAIVGEASIIVRAITTMVRRDIQKALSGMDRIGSDAGKSLSKGFNKEASKITGGRSVRQLAADTQRLTAEAIRAQQAFRGLVKTSFTLGPVVSVLVGAVSALIGSLLSLVGAAGAAGASIVVLGNIMGAMGLAMLSVKIAMGGVMEALGQMNKTGGGATKSTDAIRRAQERLAEVIEQNNEAIVTANNRITEAQLNLNDALAAGREELQQLAFAAEEAALAQQGAALDLERAREELARVQDLPPNSRLRREAELAFAQAELQYRQALDANADIATEQERYVESGIEGTQQVIDARRDLAAAEADLARTVRDGLRSQIAAERALAEARKGTGGGGADPFENLTKSQKEFVIEMNKLRPLFRDVKEQVASAFLPLFGRAMNNFAKNVLPTVGDGLAGIAREMGLAADGSVKFLQSAEGLSLLESFFTNSRNLISPLSKAFGELSIIVLRLLNAAAPQAERFVDSVRNAFSTFNNFLDSLPVSGQGSIGEFFQQSGDAASEFGTLFNEVFRYIGQLIKVNLGEDSPGRDFVRWLGAGLKASNDIRESNLFGPNGLADYFEKVNNNTKQVLSSLAGLGRVLADIGTNQAIGDTFTILTRGSQDLRNILNSLADAGPSLAKLFNTLLGIAAVFTDSQSIKLYFDIINSVASAFLDFISLPAINAFIDAIGSVTATFLAFSVILNTTRFFILVVIGLFANLALSINSLILGTGGLTLAFTGLGLAIKSAAESAILWVMYNPVLAAIAVTVAVVAGAFILLNNHIESTASTAEDFQNAIENSKGSIATLDALTKKVTLNEMLDPTQIERNNEGMKNLNQTYNVGVARFSAFNNIASLGVVPLKNLADGTAELKAIQEDTTNAIFDFNTKAAELPDDIVVRGFQNIIDGGNASREKTLEIINTNDELKKSLVEIANQAGITASDSNLVSIAMRDMKDAALDAALGLPTLGEELSSLSDRAVSAIEAGINLRDAYRGAKDSAKEYDDYLNGNQRQQDKATKVLLDMRSAIFDNVDAMRLQGDSAQEISDELEKQRGKFIKLAESMGASAVEAEDLAKKLLGQPDEVETILKQRVALDTTSARNEISQFANYVTSQFSGKLPTAIVDSINKYIKANFSGGGSSIVRTSGAGSNILGRTLNAVGNMYTYGGEGIYSGRAAGIHKFAEPETGWEAFISGRKGSEDRNRGILREAASRLGMNMGGGGVNIVVNASPGMDERALAGAVSQEITKLMRKGSIY